MANNDNQVTFNGCVYMWNGNFWYDVKTFMVPSTVIAGNLTKELSKKLGVKPNIIIENNSAH